MNIDTFIYLKSFSFIIIIKTAIRFIGECEIKQNHMFLALKSHLHILVKKKARNRPIFEKRAQNCSGCCRADKTTPVRLCARYASPQILGDYKPTSRDPEGHHIQSTA